MRRPWTARRTLVVGGLVCGLACGGGADLEGSVVDGGKIDGILAAAGTSVANGYLPAADKGLDGPGLAALLDRPEVPALRVVRLASNRLGPDAGALIATHAKLSAVDEIDLGFNPLGDAGLVGLAQGPSLRGARSVFISGAEATGSGVEALAAVLGAAEFVNASFQPAGDRGAIALAALPKLERLVLEDAGLTGVGVQAALQSRARTVALERNDVGTGALSGLTTLGPRLQGVDLARTGLGPDDARTLAMADAPALRSLSLSHNPLGPSGAEALAASPLMLQLTALELFNCGFDAASTAKLVAAWGDRDGLMVTDLGR